MAHGVAHTQTPRSGNITLGNVKSLSGMRVAGAHCGWPGLAGKVGGAVATESLAGPTQECGLDCGGNGEL